MYGGFVVPQSYLDDSVGWVSWANPLFYTQQTLPPNEFVGHKFLRGKDDPSGFGLVN